MPWDERIKRGLKLRDLDILMAVVETGSMEKLRSGSARFSRASLRRSPTSSIRSAYGCLTGCLTAPSRLPMPVHW